MRFILIILTLLLSIPGGAQVLTGGGGHPFGEEESRTKESIASKIQRFADHLNHGLTTREGLPSYRSRKNLWDIYVYLRLESTFKKTDHCKTPPILPTIRSKQELHEEFLELEKDERLLPYLKTAYKLDTSHAQEMIVYFHEFNIPLR